MDSKTDPTQSSAEALRYPWEHHPGPDQVVEVMPGVLWVRLALPFRLNHVNIYLLADGDGWAMVDSGFGNEESIAAWTALFEGPLAHVKITRLIVTHSHPDHVGLAGWIVERFNCPLYMSQVEYLQSVYHQNRGTEERKMAQRLFFRRHGMDESLTDKLLGRQTVLVVRSGAEQDFAQCQRLGGRARPELARRIFGVAGEPHHHPSLRPAGAARPRRAVLRIEDAHQAIGRPSRGPLPADRRRLPGNFQNIQGTGAGGVPQARAGRASDGLCRRRVDRPCQLHAGRGASDRQGKRRRAAFQDHLIFGERAPLGVTSPLVGEHRPPSVAVLKKNAEAKLRLRRIDRCDPGEGLRPVDSPCPLSPTLSHKGSALPLVQVLNFNL